jgi:predicted dehydrogenase
MSDEPRGSTGTRRDFLATSAATGLALGLTTAPASAARASSTLRVGTIGSGGRCRELLLGAKLIPEIQVVSVCDVWDGATQATLKMAGPHARPTRTKDYREVLDDKAVDAVIIATPDHWHVRALVDALDAGKDVYIEKPLTHSLDEGPAVLAAARSHPNRVIQVGQQQRSMPHMRRCYEEVVQEGLLGKVFHARIWWNYWAYPNRPRTFRIDPRSVDWKRWLGDKPERPFDPYRFRAWRNFWDYAGGHTADLATHFIDVVHWFLHVDHPSAASSAGALYFSEDGRETPDVIHTLWTYDKYPDKLVVTWEGNQHNGADGAGIEFHGTNGTLYIDRQLYEWKPRDGQAVTYHDGELPRGHFNVRPDQDAAHLKDWVDAVRDRRPPRVPIELGVNAAGASHLGNLAYRTRTRVEWPHA